jgi:hypothetical protein
MPSRAAVAGLRACRARRDTRPQRQRGPEGRRLEHPESSRRATSSAARHLDLLRHRDDGGPVRRLVVQLGQRARGAGGVRGPPGHVPRRRALPAADGGAARARPEHRSTMADPCAGVPANAWRPSGRPVGSVFGPAGRHHRRGGPGPAAVAAAYLRGRRCVVGLIAARRPRAPPRVPPRCRTAPPRAPDA